MQKEEYYSWNESNTSSCVLPSKVLAFILSDEVLQYEEEAEFSTQPIRTVESFLAMNPSPIAPKFYEIFDTSYSHIDDLEEDIWISVVEEKISFHSTQLFSSDFSILNYVQSFPGKAERAKEKFNSSLSNHVVGV